MTTKTAFRLTALLLLPVAAVSAAAQAPVDLSPDELARTLAELRRTLEAQQLRIAELEKLVAGKQRETNDQLIDLELELELLADDARARSAPSVTQTQSVFNPQITVLGNMVGRFDDRRVLLDEGDGSEPERIDDRFNLREVEVDFRAAIAPSVDGALVLSTESEVPGQSETGIEESYVVLKKLPILDAAPAGLKLKVGRFRPDFGFLNKLHTHDLPWITRPRSLQTFLGEEGFIQNGVAGRFFLPSFSEHDTLEGTVELLNGGDIAIAQDTDDSGVAVLGKLGWFRDLGAGHDVEVELSTYQGKSERTLWGADFLYKWRPFSSGNRRSFLLGGELFRGDFEDELDDDPLGYYLYTQYQFSQSTYLNLRFDRTEELADASLASETYSAYLSYYFTEFLRLRLGVEHTASDLAELDDLDTLLFELNYVFGSHPVEPYWVNR